MTCQSLVGLLGRVPMHPVNLKNEICFFCNPEGVLYTNFDVPILRNNVQSLTVCGFH